jgi:hypothetical protein
MKKAFWNILKVSPAIALSLLTGNSAFAGEANEQVTSVTQLSQESNSLGQVTSVSQFSDVQPTDWAFQSLQSLVERYGCIAGYPNGTFRGNRALSRYEFAAGLNSCLDRVNELIATATADMVSREDLSTLQRLQEEYSTELATIRGQVDALEARTGELEANQFSTTTKLKGEAIFGLSQAFGDNNATGAALESNTTFSNRVRLSLESSFMGTDKLQTRLEAANFVNNRNVTRTNMTRLGHDSNTQNAVELDKLNYAFNLGEKINVKIDAKGGDFNDNIEVFNSDFKSSGTGALSRFGRFSPIYRLGGDGAGMTVNIKPNKAFSLSAAYMARGANSAASPSDGQGLFDGDNAILGQLSIQPSKAFGVGLTYVRSYQSSPNLFGSTGSGGVLGTDGITSANANNPLGGATESDNYGVEVSFKPTPKITLGGWGGYTNANLVAGAGDADIWHWAATLGIKDFGIKGNTLGLIFGQPPKVTGGSAGVTTDKDTSYHIEGLYKMNLSDNILVTPGVLVILNSEHNVNNGNEVIGTLRTTFKF